MVARMPGDSRAYSENTTPEQKDEGIRPEKPYSELLALSRVSAAVSGLRDLDAVLDVALDCVLEIMNGSIGWILLIDEESQTLSTRVYRGLSDKYANEMRLAVGEGIAGRVAQSGKAILVEDLSSDQRAAWPRLITTEGLKAFISVPLRAKDNVLGVLNVASRSAHRFTKDDMHLLHAIGDQVGVAIEQAELYARLRKGRQRYQRLAQHILVAQEEERRRVARELHDETSQTLSGLALSLQALVEIAETDRDLDDSFKGQLRKAQALTVQISTEVGRLIHELRPTLLDTLGLVPAIRRYAEDILRPIGVAVTVEAKGDSFTLPPESEVGLYRIAQGTIGNIAKHSGARNAVLSLEYKSDHLVLRMRDDGKGFDVAKLTGVDERGRGSGVFGMKERVKLMGGSCQIESGPGQGTFVTVKIPSSRSEPIAED
jgi:two-component system NarL family sensor kinase